MLGGLLTDAAKDEAAAEPGPAPWPGPSPFGPAAAITGNLELRAPRRDKLPDRREAEVIKFRVAGHKGYIHDGFYPDGRLGEVFVTMDGEGSAVGGLMNAWSAAISIGLQYGTPLAAFVAKFSYAKFEPFGVTGDPDVKMAQSLIDYVIRKLDACYPDGRRSRFESIPALPTSDKFPEGFGPMIVGDITAMPMASDSETGGPEMPQVIGILGEKNGHTNGTAPPTGSATLGVLRADTSICPCGHLAYRRGSCYCCDTCGTTSGAADPESWA